MRIIGIDPGYDRLGIAVIEKEKSETLLHSECFQTNKHSPFVERLAALGTHLISLIEKYNPQDIAIENVFFNTNQKTAMDVAAVRGVIMFIAHTRGIPVHEYTPPQVKVAITGNGRASKNDVACMLTHLVVLPDRRRFDDEDDAIAVALTHAAHTRV